MGRDGVFRRRGTGPRENKTIIRHSDEEWARVKSMADAQGVSVPRLYVSALSAGDAVAAAKLTSIMGELVLVARLVGNATSNINQIAAVANSIGEIDTIERVEASVRYMGEQLDRLHSLMSDVPGGDLFRRR